MEELTEYKIFYNKDGWICERYPNDLPIDSKKRFLIVGKDTFYKTLDAANHFAWRVVDGEIKHERYEETPEDEVKQFLGEQRAEVCFPIINRGLLWYEGLTMAQKTELKKWYKAWLEVTQTKTEPLAPEWLFNLEGGNGTNTN